jgi:ATP-dependent DNA helicase RecG
LTGGTSEPQRREIYEGLANGSVQVIVGTHALIQERVEFADLALAVIDEQHRFGVEERGALRGKGVNPHILVMTATPIPRTLALTLYADLDLTVLDEMPPGRTPIETRLLFNNERERAYSFIKSQLEQGRQAFIIYPLVEASDSLEAAAAVEAYEALRATTFRHYRVGLMHGRLRPDEKEAVMASIASGEIDLLISTSVIEVGIDVPNATVILIEGANRFGLAQLHQFRGRVGRGSYPSYCLISDTDSPDVVARLQELEKTTDGFALAELDWKLRGPGDLLGTRQAGFGAVRLDRSMDPRLVELAQRESRALYEEDSQLAMPEHALLAQRVRLLQDRRTDLS